MSSPSPLAWQVDTGLQGGKFVRREGDRLWVTDATRARAFALATGKLLDEAAGCPEEKYAVERYWGPIVVKPAAADKFELSIDGLRQSTTSRLIARKNPYLVLADERLAAFDFDRSTTEPLWSVALEADDNRCLHASSTHVWLTDPKRGGSTRLRGYRFETGDCEHDFEIGMKFEGAFGADEHCLVGAALAGNLFAAHAISIEQRAPVSRVILRERPILTFGRPHARSWPRIDCFLGVVAGDGYLAVPKLADRTWAVSPFRGQAMVYDGWAVAFDSSSGVLEGLELASLQSGLNAFRPAHVEAPPPAGQQIATVTWVGAEYGRALAKAEVPGIGVLNLLPDASLEVGAQIVAHAPEMPQWSGGIGIPSWSPVGSRSSLPALEVDALPPEAAPLELDWKRMLKELVAVAGKKNSEVASFRKLATAELMEGLFKLGLSFESAIVPPVWDGEDADLMVPFAVEHDDGYVHLFERKGSASVVTGHYKDGEYHRYDGFFEWLTAWAENKRKADDEDVVAHAEAVVSQLSALRR